MFTDIVHSYSPGMSLYCLVLSRKCTMGFKSENDAMRVMRVNKDTKAGIRKFNNKLNLTINLCKAEGK